VVVVGAEAGEGRHYEAVGEGVVANGEGLEELGLRYAAHACGVVWCVCEVKVCSIRSKSGGAEGSEVGWRVDR
jgi:hypothetical protein